MIKDNRKTIDLMQNLIEQYFNQFFAYKDCNRDYKLVFDNNYPYTFKIHYYHEKFDFDFEDIILEFIADKKLEDIPFTDVSEFSKAITVDKIYNSGDYGGLVYSLVDSVVSYNFDNYDITLTEDNYEIFFSLDGEDIMCSDYHGLYVEILRDMEENAYDNFIEIVDYVLEEIGYYLSSISDEYEEQEECAKFAEENYKKDIKQLIEKLEADIKIKYPNFKINNKYIYATDFDNINFICYVNLDEYYFDLNFYSYDVFEQNEFMPHINKFDYDSFLYGVEKELNIIKEEILEDLEEQEECTKFAEENYEKDVKQLIEKLEADIKIEYPDFEIDNKYIYASDFDNSDFIFKVTLDDYYFELNSFNDVFKREFIPHVCKFDYEAFLEIVKEKLNKIKKEILEDLSE